MKSLLFLIVLSILTTRTYAQYNNNALDNDKMFYMAKVEKYRKMKTIGTVLAIGGGILTVVGYNTLENAPVNYSNTLNSEENKGVLEFTLGVAALGAGIPLWIVGSHAERKYKRKLGVYASGINLNQRSAGIAIKLQL